MSTSAPSDHEPQPVTDSAVDRYPFPPRIWKDPRCIIAFGFGAGAVPYAPGTLGTLIAVPVYWLLAHLAAPWYIGTVAILFAIGVWICRHAERVLGTHDHPGIVWDEIVGYLVAMFLAPPAWVWVVIGFVLFRLFDIWKPFPIRLLERRLRGGVGTMLDDVLAGIYAWASLQVFLYTASHLSD
jgi:phosphatidylglycerophosphatase A